MPRQRDVLAVLDVLDLMRARVGAAATSRDGTFPARVLEDGGWHGSGEAIARGLIDAVVDPSSRGSGRVGS